MTTISISTNTSSCEELKDNRASLRVGDIIYGPLLREGHRIYMLIKGIINYSISVENWYYGNCF